MNKQPTRPPRPAERFLRWFCADEVIESLQGDLYELYERRLGASGKRKADLYFYLDVLDVCRPFAWKKRSSIQNHLTMFSINLKISLRNLKNNVGSNVLNVIGLMLGVFGAVIIFLTLRYESSFDAFHQNNSEIYRVTNNYYYPTFTMHTGRTPDPMAEALRNDFPAFERVAAIHNSYHHDVTVGDEVYEVDILYCSPIFIEMFDYYNNPDHWIMGNPHDALGLVNKTVLTQTTAERLFGTMEAAMGSTIVLRDETPVEVSAIIQDPPPNTSYPFEQLVSAPTFAALFRPMFGGVSGTTTFVQVPSSVRIEQLRPDLDRFNEKYMEPEWGEDFVSMDLQPLSEIHFDDRFGSNNYTAGKPYLWTLGLIGLFMILIACINFVNLATAKAVNRSREIGMRKILGSSRQNIVIQFMSESFILAFVALGMGLLLAQFTFPYFSELTNLNIGNEFSYTGELLLFLGVLLVGITLIMGLYPALLLSNFKPLEVIRQKRVPSLLKGLNLRRGLVALQLCTTQVLLIGAIVITYQLQLFQQKELGFNEESMLVINVHGDQPIEKKLTLKQLIRQLPFVQQTSLSSSIPMSGHHSTTGLTSKDSELKDRFNVEYVYADNDYAEAMNFELLAGTAGITPTEEDTARGFVVNETLINRLDFGSPANAVGKNINVHGYEARIIGVVRDFHTLSLHEEIKPVAMIYGIRDYRDLAVRYQTEDVRGAIAQLEASWKEVFPDKNFDYYFQDERMERMYENEERFSKIIKAFTIITIMIACLGLIGLATFSAVRRFKEIGIRKVLGASIANILYLMSKEFIVLVLIGFFVSLPIAYFMVSAWLEDFAYHVDMEWWMAAMAGLFALLLTLLTVGFQSIQAARVNPIKSIRME